VVEELFEDSNLSSRCYRRGMTPDLGKLSATWRNHGLTMLEGLLSDLAGNNLLSRAVLNGGAPPGWDVDRTPLTGYFRIGQYNRAAA